tara:strand:+ start:83 stop:1333 length:1251 start_codon:yes stop_codon:yes gene_type:complete
VKLKISSFSSLNQSYPEQHLNEMRNYWDKKILEWEKKRYLKSSYINPIQRRQAIIREFLLSMDPGLTVLELGCGTGLLYKSIAPEKKFKKYYLVDISKVATDQLQTTVEDSNVKIINSSIRNLDINILKEADLILSSGLLDWLEIDEIEKIAKYSKGKTFIHTFSIKSFSPIRLLHATYMKLLRLKFKSLIVSRYHTKQDIYQLFGHKSFIQKYYQGSFGRIITNQKINKLAIRNYFKARYKEVDYQKKQSSFPWILLKKLEQSLYLDYFNKHLKEGTTLNIGANTFGLTDFKKGNKITTIDPCCQDANIIDDFEIYNFNQKFDMIVMIGVIEFFESPPKSVKKAHHLLKENGYLIVFLHKDTFLTSLYYRFHKNRGINLTPISERDFINLIEKTGFTIEETRSFPLWANSYLIKK